MTTHYIPLPDDESRQASLLSIVTGLDEYFPGQLTITEALVVTTANPDLATVLRVLIQDEQALHELPEPEPQTPAAAPMLDFEQALESIDAAEVSEADPAGLLEAADPEYAAHDPSQDPERDPEIPDDRLCAREGCAHPRRVRSNYCSKACYMADYQERHPKETAVVGRPRQCQCGCGETFIPHSGAQRFVDRKHQNRAYSHKDRPQQPLERAPLTRPSSNLDPAEYDEAVQALSRLNRRLIVLDKQQREVWQIDGTRQRLSGDRMRADLAEGRIRIGTKLVGPMGRLYQVVVDPRDCQPKVVEVRRLASLPHPRMSA